VVIYQESIIIHKSVTTSHAVKELLIREWLAGKKMDDIVKVHQVSKSTVIDILGRFIAEAGPSSGEMKILADSMHDQGLTKADLAGAIRLISSVKKMVALDDPKKPLDSAQMEKACDQFEQWYQTMIRKGVSPEAVIAAGVKAQAVAERFGVPVEDVPAELDRLSDNMVATAVETNKYRAMRDEAAQEAKRAQHWREAMLLKNHLLEEKLDEFSKVKQALASHGHGPDKISDVADFISDIKARGENCHDIIAKIKRRIIMEKEDEEYKMERLQQFETARRLDYYTKIQDMAKAKKQRLIDKLSALGATDEEIDRMVSGVLKLAEQHDEAPPDAFRKILAAVEQSAVELARRKPTSAGKQVQGRGKTTAPSVGIADTQAIVESDLPGTRALEVKRPEDTAKAAVMTSGIVSSSYKTAADVPASTAIDAPTDNPYCLPVTRLQGEAITANSVATGSGYTPDGNGMRM
jgi:hypothetical protein